MTESLSKKAGNDRAKEGSGTLVRRNLNYLFDAMSEVPPLPSIPCKVKSLPLKLRHRELFGGGFKSSRVRARASKPSHPRRLPLLHPGETRE